MLESLPALHDVGQVQPAGAVLVIDAETEEIVASSANLESRVAHWSAEDALGTRADAVLGRPVLHDIRNAAILPSFTRLPEFLGVTNLGASDIEISVHGAGGHIVVEVCDAQPEPSALTLVKDLSRIEDRMRASHDMAELFKTLAGLMRIMSGYDRLQALQLKGDGTTVVLAESCRALLESTLRQDLPAPMALSGAQLPPYRYVVDAACRPASVLALAEIGVELSLCQTVMPTPAHCQLLTELGMRSEMIIPLRSDDELWGFIVFQGQRARSPSPRFKYLCMSMAPLLNEMLSGRIRGMSTL